MSSFIAELLQRLSWLPVRVFFGHYLNFSVEGTTNLRGLPAREGQGAVFAANHIWPLDPVLMAAALPFFSSLLPLHVISLHKKYYRGLKGWNLISGGYLFRLLGSYPVQLGLRNYEHSLADYINLLARNKSVAIFPEGGLQRPDHPQNIRPGLGFLAWRTRAHVVPVHIVPSGEMTVGSLFKRTLKVSVRFGAPISFQQLMPEKKEYGTEDFKHFATLIMAQAYAL